MKNRRLCSILLTIVMLCVNLFGQAGFSVIAEDDQTATGIKTDIWSLDESRQDEYKNEDMELDFTGTYLTSMAEDVIITKPSQDNIRDAGGLPGSYNFAADMKAYLRIPNDGWYTFNLAAGGANIKMYIDGEEIVSTYDPNNNVNRDENIIYLTAGDHEWNLKWYAFRHVLGFELKVHIDGEHAAQDIPESWYVQEQKNIPEDMPEVLPTVMGTPTPCPVNIPEEPEEDILYVYDGFDYDDGALVDQNGGEGAWRDKWQVQDAKETNPRVVVSKENALIYPSLKSTQGYATTSNDGARAGRRINVWEDCFSDLRVDNDNIGAANTSVWFSALMQLNGTDDIYVGLHSDGTGWYMQDGVFDRRSIQIGTFGSNSLNEAGKKVWTLRSNQHYVKSDVVVKTNETAFIAVQVIFDNELRGALVRAYINPDVSKPLGEPSAEFRIWGSQFKFQSICIDTGSKKGNAKADEIRLGNSFRAVAPLSNFKLPVTKVEIWPANGDVSTLAGAKIVGSNDTATNGFVDIFDLGDTPTLTDGRVVLKNAENDIAYRYVKLYGAAGSAAKVADMKFYSGKTLLEGDPFASVAKEGSSAANAFDGDPNTYYEGAQADDQYVGLDLGGETVAAMPKADPLPGKYDEPISVNLSTDTVGADIYYTLDGSYPTIENGTLYDEPIQLVQNDAKIIKAIAVKEGLITSSVFAGGYGIGVTAPVARGLTTYHIGNSLTDTTNGMLERVAQSANQNHMYMRWTIPGASMPTLTITKAGGFGTPWVDPATCDVSDVQDEQYSERFDDGKYFDPDTCIYAVDRYAPIDYMVVQPFNNGDNEETYCQLYGKPLYDKAREENPNISFLVYSSWGSLPKNDKDTDFDTWLANYTKMNEKIADDMNALYDDDPSVDVVPNALALKNLQTAIEAGEFPGVDVTGFTAFAGANDTDTLHLSENGAYLVNLCTYTVMYKQNPVNNVTYKPDGLTDEQATALKQIAWDTCVNYSYANVGEEVPTPEPTAIPSEDPATEEPATETPATESPTPVPTNTPKPELIVYEGFKGTVGSGVKGFSGDKSQGFRAVWNGRDNNEAGIIKSDNPLVYNDLYSSDYYVSSTNDVMLTRYLDCERDGSPFDEYRDNSWAKNVTKDGETIWASSLIRFNDISNNADRERTFILKTGFDNTESKDWCSSIIRAGYLGNDSQKDGKRYFGLKVQVGSKDGQTISYNEETGTWSITKPDVWKGFEEIVLSDVEIEEGKTYFVTLKIDFGTYSGEKKSKVTLFINPTLDPNGNEPTSDVFIDDIEPEPYYTYSSDQVDADGKPVMYTNENRLAFSQVTLNYCKAGDVDFDEIRIGKSYLSVSPIASALDKAIIEAEDELEAAFKAYSKEEYTEANWQSLEAYYNNGVADLYTAATVDEVNTKKAAALANMAAVPEMTLEERIAKAKAQWQTFMLDYPEAKYTDENWTVVEGYCADFATAIEAAQDKEQIASILEEYKNKVISVERIIEYIDGALVRRHWGNVEGGNISHLEAFMTNERYTSNSYDGYKVMEKETYYNDPVGDQLVVSHSGYIRAPQSGVYTFRIQGSDDAVRMDLNGEKVIFYDGYNGSINAEDVSNTAVCEYEMVAGKYIPIDIMYKEASGGDLAHIQWKGPGIGDENTWTDINRKYLSFTEDLLRPEDISGAVVANPLTLNKINLTTNEYGTVKGYDAVGYEPGSTVTLTAVAKDLNTFDGWIVDGTPQSGDSVTLTMDQNHEVSAMFTYVAPTPMPTDVYNGDFKEGLNGWTVPDASTGTVVTTTTEGVGDNASMHMYAEDSKGQEIKSIEFDVEPNTDYFVSFYKKGTGKFNVQIANASEYTVKNSVYWEQEKYYFNTGDLETTTLIFKNNAGAVDMDIDRVKILKVGDDDHVNISRNLSYNLVYDKDPSMEKVDENGYPRAWIESGKDYIKDGRGMGVGGSNALVFGNTDGGYPQINDVPAKNYKDQAEYARMSFKVKLANKEKITDQEVSSIDLLMTDIETIRLNAVSNDAWTEIVRYIDLSNPNLGGRIYFLVKGGHTVIFDDLKVQIVGGDDIPVPATPVPSPDPVHPANEVNLVTNPKFEYDINADDNMDGDTNSETKGWEFGKYAVNVGDLTAAQRGEYPNFTEDDALYNGDKYHANYIGVYHDATKAGTAVPSDVYQNGTVDTENGIVSMKGPSLDWDGGLYQYIDESKVVPGRYKLTITLKGHAQVFFKREAWSQDYYSCTGAYINEQEDLELHKIDGSDRFGVENVSVDSGEGLGVLDDEGWKTVAFWVDIPNYEPQRGNIYMDYQFIPKTDKFRIVITNFWTSKNKEGMNYINCDSPIPDELQVKQVSLEKIHETYHVDFVNQNNKIVADKDILKGENIGKLPTIYRDGYTFDGWYYNGTLVENYADLVQEGDPTQHIELKAKYTSKEDKYTLNLPDGVNILEVNGTPYRKEMGDAFMIDDKILLGLEDENAVVDYWSIKGLASSNGDACIKHPGFKNKPNQLKFLMPPTNNLEIEPVLLGEGQDKTILDAQTLITAVSKGFNDSLDENYVRFYMYAAFVMENTDLKDVGMLIYATDSNETPNFTESTSGVQKYKSTSNTYKNYYGDMGEYVIVKKGEKQNYWVRSYIAYWVDKVENGEIVYEEDAEGNKKPVRVVEYKYSAPVKVNMTSPEAE